MTEVLLADLKAAYAKKLRADLVITAPLFQGLMNLLTEQQKTEYFAAIAAQDAVAADAILQSKVDAYLDNQAQQAIDQVADAGTVSISALSSIYSYFCK